MSHFSSIPTEPDIEAWLPDVAVVDLLLPGGIDGIETARRIRTISPHTQVVMLTAYSDEARIAGALRAGAIGYIKKDSEPEPRHGSFSGRNPAIEEFHKLSSDLCVKSSTRILLR